MVNYGKQLIVSIRSCYEKLSSDNIKMLICIITNIIIKLVFVITTVITIIK